MEILIFLVVLGSIAHIVGDMIEASKLAGTPVHPIVFLKSRPYRTIMSLIGASIGYIMLMHDLDKQVQAELYQSAYALAFGIGYAADSMINKAANIAEQQVNK